MKREIWKRTINILKEMASKMGEQLTLVFVYYSNHPETIIKYFVTNL